MKISYLMSDLGYSGGSQTIYEYMDGLVSRGHSVYAVTPGTSFLWEKGIKEEIRKYYVYNKKVLGEADNSLFADSFSRNLISSFRVKKDDISLAYFAMGKITEALVSKCPVSDFVVATHNFTAHAAFYLSDVFFPIYYVQGFEENFYKNFVFRKNAALTYNFPFLLVCNSSELKTKIKKMYGKESVVINPGLDTEVFRPYADPKEKYFKGKDFLTVGYYYSPNPLKGAGYFLKALENLDKKIKFKLKIYGSDPKDLFSKFDFEYCGKIFGKELAKFYSSCDVFVNSSDEESFPLPAIEAMGCGTLVITTDAGNSDYVEKDFNAIVVEKSSPFEITNALSSVFLNRGNFYDYVINGIKTARRFSWDNSVKEFELLLIKIKEGKYYEKEGIDNRRR